MSYSGRSSPNLASSVSALSSSVTGSLSSVYSWTLRRLASDNQDSEDNNAITRYFNASSYSEEEQPTTQRGSPYIPPALVPLSLVVSPKASNILLTTTIAEEIRLLLPARLQLHEEWKLVYQLEQHGASLTTLYSCQRQGSHILVLKDTYGDIFGAYVNEPFRPSGRYYGSGECFLWKTCILKDVPDYQNGHGMSINADSIRFKAFPYSGDNDYLIFCEPTFLSLGGGDGHYGLWVDDDFLKGVSAPCPTFGNEALSEAGNINREMEAKKVKSMFPLPAMAHCSATISKRKITLKYE